MGAATAFTARSTAGKDEPQVSGSPARLSGRRDTHPVHCSAARATTSDSRPPESAAAAPVPKNSKAGKVLDLDLMNELRSDPPPGPDGLRRLLLRRRFELEPPARHLSAASAAATGNSMVATRTTEGGRLQGLPSVRHIRDPSPEPSEEATEQQGASKGRKQQRGVAASRKQHSGPKAAEAGNAGKNSIAVLSDRRYAPGRSAAPARSSAAVRRRRDASHPPLFVFPALRSQAPGTLVEGVPHTFWVVVGEDGSGRLPVDACVKAKVSAAAAPAAAAACCAPGCYCRRRRSSPRG